MTPVTYLMCALGAIALVAFVVMAFPDLTR